MRSAEAAGVQSALHHDRKHLSCDRSVRHQDSRRVDQAGIRVVGIANTTTIRRCTREEHHDRSRPRSTKPSLCCVRESGRVAVTRPAAAVRGHAAGLAHRCRRFQHRHRHRRARTGTSARRDYFVHAGAKASGVVRRAPMPRASLAPVARKLNVGVEAVRSHAASVVIPRHARLRHTLIFHRRPAPCRRRVGDDAALISATASDAGYR